MRKNKIESKPVKIVPAPVSQKSVTGGCEYNQPKQDSWTAQNMGPDGYIDAAGVPCSPLWRD